MKWPKDRKKAFLVAAEAFGTPLNKRSERQRTLTSAGICKTIWELVGYSGSSWLVHLGIEMGMTSFFWWPLPYYPSWTPACDEERSLFCCLMATLSDKEFEELSR